MATNLPSGSATPSHESDDVLRAKVHVLSTLLAIYGSLSGPSKPAPKSNSQDDLWTSVSSILSMGTEGDHPDPVVAAAGRVIIESTGTYTVDCAIAARNCPCSPRAWGCDAPSTLNGGDETRIVLDSLQPGDRTKAQTLLRTPDPCVCYPKIGRAHV